MLNVNASALQAFDDDLASILREATTKRRELHEELGDLAKQELDRAILASGLRDDNGKIRRWQVKRIGSRGGYAAISASGVKDGGTTGPNSEGAITNYLESGHKIRRPSGRAARYRPRIRVTRVPAFGFYKAVNSTFEATAIKATEKFAEQLAKRLEGS